VSVAGGAQPGSPDSGSPALPCGPPGSPGTAGLGDLAGLRDAQIEALYLAHYQTLLRTAVLLLGGEGSAEDVVQEAFIRVYGSWSKIRDPARATAYLRATTVNLARSTLRARLLALRHPPPAPAELAGPDERAMLMVRSARVVRALHALPRRQREVVVLRYYADLSVSETAQALQISAGAVKSYGSRGLAALALALADMREELG
jgi:RNA polymerase sigma-70 factor (sigma-E family)